MYYGSHARGPVKGPADSVLQSIVPLQKPCLINTNFVAFELLLQSAAALDRDFNYTLAVYWLMLTVRCELSMRTPTNSPVGRLTHVGNTFPLSHAHFLPVPIRRE